MVPRVLPREVTRSEKQKGKALGATSQVELPGVAMTGFRDVRLNAQTRFCRVRRPLAAEPPGRQLHWELGCQSGYREGYTERVLIFAFGRRRNERKDQSPRPEGVGRGREEV